jgi:inhibitor of cysteine peptidase
LFLKIFHKKIMGKKITALYLIVISTLGIAVSAQNYESSNRIIEANIGQTFTIIIASNPTTGYQWKLAQSLDEKIIKFVGSRYIAAKKRLIGSGGKEEWVFKAVGKGVATIILEYNRPWEGDTTAKKVIFNVIVR